MIPDSTGSLHRTVRPRGPSLPRSDILCPPFLFLFPDNVTIKLLTRSIGCYKTYSALLSASFAPLRDPAKTGRRFTLLDRSGLFLCFTWAPLPLQPAPGTHETENHSICQARGRVGSGHTAESRCLQKSLLVGLPLEIAPTLYIYHCTVKQWIIDVFIPFASEFIIRLDRFADVPDLLICPIPIIHGR